MGAKSSRGVGFVRMWRLLVLLRQGPQTLVELARMLGVSSRTIRRDLELLRRVPLPVASRFPEGRKGVRAEDATEWFVTETAAWPSGDRIPLADITDGDIGARA